MKSFWNARYQTEEPSLAYAPFHALRSLREGFLSNVLNPKTIIFYMAFLPQFIDPAQSALSQFFLALLHFIIGTLRQGILVYMICSANRLILKPSVRQKLDLTSGLIMLGLGFAFLFEKRS